MLIWQNKLFIILLIAFSGFDLIFSDCGADIIRSDADLCNSQKYLNWIRNIDNGRSFKQRSDTTEQDERVFRIRVDSDNRLEFRRTSINNDERVFRNFDASTIRRENFDVSLRLNEREAFLGSRKNSIHRFQDDNESRVNRIDGARSVHNDMQRQPELPEAHRQETRMVGMGLNHQQDNFQNERLIRDDADHRVELRGSRMKASSINRRGNSQNEQARVVNRQSGLHEAHRRDIRMRKNGLNHQKDNFRNERLIRDDADLRAELRGSRMKASSINRRGNSQNEQARVVDRQSDLHEAHRRDIRLRENGLNHQQDNFRNERLIRDDADHRAELRGSRMKVNSINLRRNSENEKVRVVERRSELREAHWRDIRMRENSLNHQQDNFRNKRLIRNDADHRAELRDSRMKASSLNRRGNSQNEQARIVDRQSNLREAHRRDDRMRTSSRVRQVYSANDMLVRGETELRMDTEQMDAENGKSVLRHNFTHETHRMTEELLRTKFAWSLVQFALIGVIICKIMQNDGKHKSKSFGDHFGEIFQANIGKTVKIS